MSYSTYQPQHLQPKEYLERFKMPHSVITNAKSQYIQKDIEIVQSILDIDYNDTNKSRETKEMALAQLRGIVKTWLLKINPNISSRCGLEIFGSYRLGVSSKDSDIDAVCIVPPYVDRQQHFFGGLISELSTNPNVSQVFPIPTALIPLIKLKLHRVQFDILLSRIPEKILESDFEFDSPVLELVQQREKKSLNGCRIIAYLLSKTNNHQVFRVTLKAIKMWARNRGVYLQIFSYVGGIGYTVLLAKIMELYPNYSPLKLLSRFFYIYSKWTWEIPVVLQKESLVQNQKTQMTIMTPVLPVMNASHSVSKTTLRIIRREFKQAYKTVEQIQKGVKKWNDLFAPVDILRKYKHFLQISIMANTKGDFMSWKGYIESRFRRFYKLLENKEDGNIQVRPFPKELISKHVNYKFCSRYYIGIRCRSHILQDDMKQVDFTQPVRDFLEIIEGYAHNQKIPNDINIGISRVTSDVVGVELGKNPDTFYKYY